MARLERYASGDDCGRSTHGLGRIDREATVRSGRRLHLRNRSFTGSQWAALWTGKYADIIDLATGKCLGCCQAGGFNGRLLTFNLAPDGRRLAASFTGWPKDLPGQGAGNTTVVWNLETG